MLLDIDFHIDNVVGEYRDILDLAVLDLDFAVLGIELS